MRCHPAVALALLLAACAAEQPRAPAVAFDVAPFRTFLVSRPLLPFAIEGAVEFRYRGESQSGRMVLQALPGPVFRLELYAPLTGGKALDVRLDPQRLLVIDYVDRVVLRAPNTPAMRLRLFDMDLSPDELLTLLTGRVGSARFAAGGGERAPAAPGSDEARYRDGAAEQRFRLDAHGLPSAWVKEAAGDATFRVEFRDYLELPQAAGPPLRLPRKVRLYRDAGPARLVVGVRDFQPGATGAADWDPDTVPADAMDFPPGTLPEPAPASVTLPPEPAR